MPQWLKIKIPKKGESGNIEKILKSGNIPTVCEEAKCPNRAECYCNGTATFLVLGDICSRHCSFCSVSKGQTKPLDPNEPEIIANAIKDMKINYAVITMVTRDDLPDGGSQQVADIVKAVKMLDHPPAVEVLVSDMLGNRESIETIVNSGIDVFNHNIEMIPELYKKNRPEGDYSRSLSVLSMIKEIKEIPVKTGFMVGLGETDDDIKKLLQDLKKCGINIVTIGQYLRPSRKQVEVKRYVTPEQFEKYKLYGESIGIPHVESSPFVRSSYNAFKILEKLRHI